MPRVNLVPKEEAAREYRRQFLIIPVASVAIIFIGMAGSYIYYGQKLQSSKDELDQYKQNNENQKRDIAELDGYEAVGKEKQDKQVQVGTLELSRHKWSRTLDDIAFVVPDDIWFKDIQGQVPWLQVNLAESSAAAGGEDYNFIIEGRTGADSMPSVAIFMVRLGLIPSLENVELIFAEKILEDGREVIKFEIGASLKQNLAVTQPAIAPSTGEEAPSNGAMTGTGTSTTSTNGSTGTGTTGTSTGTGR